MHLDLAVAGVHGRRVGCDTTVKQAAGKRCCHGKQLACCVPVVTIGFTSDSAIPGTDRWHALETQVEDTAARGGVQRRAAGHQQLPPHPGGRCARKGHDMLAFIVTSSLSSASCRCCCRAAAAVLRLREISNADVQNDGLCEQRLRFAVKTHGIWPHAGTKKKAHISPEDVERVRECGLKIVELYRQKALKARSSPRLLCTWEIRQSRPELSAHAHPTWRSARRPAGTHKRSLHGTSSLTTVCSGYLMSACTRFERSRRGTRC